MRVDYNRLADKYYICQIDNTSNGIWRSKCYYVSGADNNTHKVLSSVNINDALLFDSKLDALKFYIINIYPYITKEYDYCIKIFRFKEELEYDKYMVQAYAERFKNNPYLVKSKTNDIE